MKIYKQISNENGRERFPTLKFFRVPEPQHKKHVLILISLPLVDGGGENGKSNET